MTAIYGIQNTDITKVQFTELLVYLKNHHAQSQNNILLGDFNFCDNDLDRTRGLSKNDKSIQYMWMEFLSHLSISDPFREQFPTKKMFS